MNKAGSSLPLRLFHAAVQELRMLQVIADHSNCELQIIQLLVACVLQSCEVFSVLQVLSVCKCMWSFSTIVQCTYVWAEV